MSLQLTLKVAWDWFSSHVEEIGDGSLMVSDDYTGSIYRISYHK